MPDRLTANQLADSLKNLSHIVIFQVAADTIAAKPDFIFPAEMLQLLNLKKARTP